MNDGSHNVILVEMGDYLQLNPQVVYPLATLYCGIWPDAPWHEYMKCSGCGRYYSQAQYHAEGISTCSYCYLPLRAAWIASEVVENIRAEMQLSGFIGYLLINPTEGPVGFTWGFLRNTGDLSRLSQHINAGEVWYYCELAVKNDARYRNKGLGSMLVRNAVREARNRFADYPTLLRTHELGPAFDLFKRAGYRCFEHEPDINPNRVLMMADSCSKLDPTLPKVRQV